MYAAVIIFALSLLGITTLLSLKVVEERRGARFAARLRESADIRALNLKSFALQSREELAKLPPFLLLFSRVLVREAALGLAASARYLEGQAHRLADLVSHKRGFERRETKSEFLKQVTDFKASNGESLEEKKEL